MSGQVFSNHAGDAIAFLLHYEPRGRRAIRWRRVLAVVGVVLAATLAWRARPFVARKLEMFAMQERCRAAASCEPRVVYSRVKAEIDKHRSTDGYCVSIALDGQQVLLWYPDWIYPWIDAIGLARRYGTILPYPVGVLAICERRAPGGQTRIITMEMSKVEWLYYTVGKPGTWFGNPERRLAGETCNSTVLADAQRITFALDPRRPDVFRLEYDIRGKHRWMEVRLKPDDTLEIIESIAGKLRFFPRDETHLPPTQ